MKNVFSISGMTCEACVYKVNHLLSEINGVTAVNIDLAKGEAEITTDQLIGIATLQNALSGTKYQLSAQTQMVEKNEEESKSWLETYKPVLLIFAYITVTTLVIQFAQGKFHWAQWMNHFMAGFFLVFSFFKLLNLRGFAESYAMYDIVAKKWNGYGYVYAFLELAFGIGFLLNFNPLILNSVVCVVMLVSIIGVLQSVLNKKTIRCACLGDVFNLPMSTITIIEDGLMILMSGAMLANELFPFLEPM